VVVVIGLNVRVIGIVGEFGNLEELRILGEIEINGKISWVVFEVIKFADVGLFGLEVDDELKNVCIRTSDALRASPMHQVIQDLMHLMPLMQT
ncbi:hypothetical protein Tco_1442781, partial [Tanacetum coccineum]